MHKHAAVCQLQQTSVTISWCSRPKGVQRSCSTPGCLNQTVLPASGTHPSKTHTPQASTRPPLRSHHHIHCLLNSSASAEGRSGHVSAAAKGAAMHPMDSPVAFRKNSAVIQSFGQCILLAVAAVGAAPALLLLDIAEQSVLGLGLLEMATQASRRQPAQQKRQLVHLQQQPPEQQQQHLHSIQHHHQQQQWQQQQQLLPALSVGYAGRPLLPLWPPLLPMLLVAAPLGLLLWPSCRQTVSVPLLLLAASLVVQAYINLVLVVCTRVSAHPKATGAPAAWAVTGTRAASVPAAAAAAGPTAAGGALARGGVLSVAAVRVFAWLQLLCDMLRVACCACTAWLTVQAVSAGSSLHWCRALQHGAGDLSVLIAAASAGAAALQQLLGVWWGPACIAALCSASAAVHALSLLARCNVLMLGQQG